jgi:DNA-binding LacI/PurR family transcriptional regulator
MTTTNIRDVARRAGVSIATVSNVLNHPDVVAPTTRGRVLKAIADLGYIRNDSARQLRAGRSRQIAVVVLDLANPFFTDVVSGTESAVEDQDIMVVVCNSRADPGRERRHLDLLAEQRVRGVLITPVDDQSEPVLEQLVRRGTSVVLVDRCSGRPSQCSVSVDDVLGGRLAATHLRSRGHRRLAFVGGPFTVTQVVDRHDGFVTALPDRPAVTVVATPTMSVAAGRVAAGRLADIPAPRRPTAVFCGNDLIALGVLQEMTRRGVRVPQDLAIVGYDDIDFAAAAAVPLSSVRQPREQLGRAAAQLLLEEMEDPSAHEHRHVLFKPELVVRESSADLRTAPVKAD